MKKWSLAGHVERRTGNPWITKATASLETGQVDEEMRGFGAKEWIRIAQDGSSWKPMREAFR